MSFIDSLSKSFIQNSDKENALYMHEYMRGKFTYFGIKTKQRRELLKDTIEKHKEEMTTNVRTIALALYKLPEREFHLCATEIFEKYLRKKYQKNDIKLIETLITTHSWWDTVDFIAKQILGKYLQIFPEELETIISRFTTSNDLWLNRSTIVFQLGYKNNTIEDILFKQCNYFKENDEFFIKKAIGWALREYGKTNPQSVLNFVNSTNLKPLSRKEAIRNIVS
jgi:3-methyladenine DNA glycosylase AlkD